MIPDTVSFGFAVGLDTASVAVEEQRITPDELMSWVAIRIGNLADMKRAFHAWESEHFERVTQREAMSLATALSRFVGGECSDDFVVIHLDAEDDIFGLIAEYLECRRELRDLDYIDPSDHVYEDIMHRSNRRTDQS